MNWKFLIFISNGAPHRSISLPFTKQSELLSLELHFLTFLYFTSIDVFIIEAEGNACHKSQSAKT